MTPYLSRPPDVSSTKVRVKCKVKHIITTLDSDNVGVTFFVEQNEGLYCTLFGVTASYQKFGILVRKRDFDLSHEEMICNLDGVLFLSLCVIFPHGVEHGNIV